jgi:hypothetical protein
MILLLVILVSCATAPKISLLVQRSPILNTAGINRIAIMPFEGGRVYASAAQYATSQATTNLHATNHFTLVSASAVTEARRRGESLDAYIDAIFTGQIVNVTVSQPYPVTTTRTDREGREHSTTTWQTIVEVQLTYHFERVRDGSMIGPRNMTRRVEQSSTTGRPETAELQNMAIAQIFQQIQREVAPHTVLVQRTFQRETNKDLRPQMAELENQVKAGNRVVARRGYEDLWRSHQSVAAAINASYLIEATGETQEAANFMQTVFTATGNPSVNARLNELNRELGEVRRLQEFAEASQSPMQRVTEHAVSEINKVLPASAKLWIYNNSTTNQFMANDIVDNLTSIFIRNRITIVDRQMIDIAISEIDFQLTDNVSDADMVRIGGMTGATTIVFINVSGAGAGRRLNVRVLDISTGRVSMQSGATNEWNL